MSRQTIAIIIVVALFGQFTLLLLASLIRSRRAARALEEAGEGRAVAPGVPKPAEEPKKPAPISRREFARRSLLASLGLFTAQFGAASLAFLWPSLKGGFGSVIELEMTPDQIKESIDEGREPFYFGAGRFYMVKYEVDPVPEVYHGFVAEGLMALYQRCVHLGCRVPWCLQSQWFECPCHGSKYNRVGEYEDGPAPRGMDRFPITFEGGKLKVDTSFDPIGDGPPRGTDTIHQTPEGPFCVNIGTAAG